MISEDEDESLAQFDPQNIGALRGLQPGIKKKIGALQLEEVAEIKRTAKIGNEAATKILAKQLIRLRQHISNLQGSSSQMRAIATHTQAMHAQSSVVVGMKGASKAMATMNKVGLI
ncbi:vacuolar protein sorting-associated protein 2 homolog 3-like [Rosa chinensis]|uniref:vacuolar protein sorting-associated protein 2 homolog 3-like n=1 Tax=Rosa chinensis TaxID=74649 RepID=UPI000D08693B|nr:vacuolar protein sorting-associated protein 2 homolog 3-like [Rosa chinensis]